MMTIKRMNGKQLQEHCNGKLEGQNIIVMVSKKKYSDYIEGLKEREGIYKISEKPNRLELIFRLKEDACIQGVADHMKMVLRTIDNERTKAKI